MRHFVCAAALALFPALTVLPAQEKVVATPPSITTEGIPPIPQSIADGLARYAQFRQAQLMAWHPVKRQIVITTNLGSVNQLYSIDGPVKCPCNVVMALVSARMRGVGSLPREP